MKPDAGRQEVKLFIDESGTANVRDNKSSYYIISACSIFESERHKMKILADQVKYKYWSRTDIILHSREIGRKENNFTILKDEKVFTSFLVDLEALLTQAKYKMYFVIVDKSEARSKNWNSNKIYQETASHTIRNFLLILLSNNTKGKIIVESASAEKDFYFHKSVGFFLSEGLPEVDVDYLSVRDRLTSISFVTKNNFDIEEQVADILAYAAKCRHLSERQQVALGEYEKMLLRVLDKKLFREPDDKVKERRKFYKHFKPIIILPENK